MWYLTSPSPLTILSISDEWSKDPSYIIFEKTEDGDADNEGKYALALSRP